MASRTLSRDRAAWSRDLGILVLGFGVGALVLVTGLGAYVLWVGIHSDQVPLIAVGLALVLFFGGVLTNAAYYFVRHRGEPLPPLEAGAQEGQGAAGASGSGIDISRQHIAAAKAIQAARDEDRRRKREAEKLSRQ